MSLVYQWTEESPSITSLGWSNFWKILSKFNQFGDFGKMLETEG